MTKVATLFVLASMSLAIVSCGSNSSPTTTSSTATESNGASAREAGKTSAGGGSTIHLEADPKGQLAYTTAEVTVKAGKVTIDFRNPQALPHDVAVENEEGETIGQTELITEGETLATMNLRTGTYHYYCTVPGHREAGMEGTLVVR